MSLIYWLHLRKTAKKCGVTMKELKALKATLKQFKKVAANEKFVNAAKAGKRLREVLKMIKETE